MFNYKNLLIGAVAATALLSSTAFAGTVTNPNLSGSATISDGTHNGSWSLDSGASFVNNGNGTFTYNSSVAGALWDFNWDLTVNPDPFINGTLTVINLNSATTTFNILFTLPVGTGFAPGLMSGSLGGSFTDYNLDGLVSLSNVNWSGIIDANPSAMSLVAFGGTCGPGSPGCNINLTTVNGGPTLYGPGVSSSIGLNLSFALSPGDKAVFTTNFTVVPVPIPAAVWLFGSGLLGLGAIARRRKI